MAATPLRGANRRAGFPSGSSATHQAVVIGAGPGGLGAASCLSANGLDVTVLEQGDDVATKWRAGYDRLHLNTSRWFSYLPNRRFPSRMGRWASRDELVAYYRDYATYHRLQVRKGVRAERIEPIEGGWRTLTSTGPFEAAVVIVATGKQHTPTIPEWPNLSMELREKLIHSAEYRNAEPFRGQRVLVVGAGNSGTDIALDLAQGGVTEVWLSARRPPHLLRREVLGVPHDAFGVVGRYAPRGLIDANARLLRRLTFGDLRDIGLSVPDDGAVTRFEEEGRVPTIDAGDFVQAVRDGHISMVAGVDDFDGREVLLEDGMRVEPDAIVAATGYHPNLGPLVGHLGLLDSKGLPVAHGADTHPSATDLYFLGFLDPRSGNLRELRLQAREIARAVARSQPSGRSMRQSG